jgi:hypothetical protein
MFKNQKILSCTKKLNESIEFIISNFKSHINYQLARLNIGMLP